MEANKSYEEQLRELVRNSEYRYISYKQMLDDFFRGKSNFKVGDDLIDWYKELLREGKNTAESDLKHFREELTDFRQGMNPPFCYNAYKRKSST